MAILTRFLLLLSFLCCLSQTACAVTETVRPDPHESDPVYQNGPFSVASPPVDTHGALNFSLWVAYPERPGRYPVVQFQHGFELQNTDYKGLLTQVASWGFIVVAPQMYRFKPTDPTAEIENARSVLNWMKPGLKAKLPAKCTPDFEKVALAGHSRGGMVVFGLAKQDVNASASQKYSAIVGLDPVDTYPSSTVLTHKGDDSLDVGVPTLIVGTGWGPFCTLVFPGHNIFYKDLKPPSFHFVAKNNGHLDFTEDCWLWDLLVIRCLPNCLGGSRQRMRQFSAGITVAFLQDVLFHNSSSFSAALTQKAKAPVLLDPPECKGHLTCPPKAHQHADI